MSKLMTVFILLLYACSIEMRFPSPSKISVSGETHFPTPAGPLKMQCGMFLCLTNASSRLIMCCCPCISENILGLYLLIQIECSPVIRCLLVKRTLKSYFRYFNVYAVVVMCGVVENL